VGAGPAAAEVRQGQASQGKRGCAAAAVGGMGPSKGKDRVKAGRYRTEDDEDDGSMASVPSGPAQCAVFKIPDEDEAKPEDIANYEKELKRVIGKLRALNLNVEQFENSSKTLLYLKISAPDTLMRYEAESNFMQLRLMPDFGGALCAYTQELEDKGAFDKPLDNCHPLFCSAFQLKIINDVVNSQAYQAETQEEMADVIDFDKLINPEEGEKIMLQYFALHHDRMRLKMLNEWAKAMNKPQPLDIVREYFGEKIGLFYTWYGYYCTMLWIPGLTGAALTITQILSFIETGSMENPYVLVYAIVISMWANAFCALWKQLENTRKFEWDTLDFENFEQLRKEFKESEKTLRSSDEGDKEPHINEITGEVEDFYYDDGKYLPMPTSRARDQVLSYTVCLINIAIVITGFIFVWVHVAQPLMGPGNVILGGILSGVLNSLIAITIDAIMDGIAELEMKGFMGWLVTNENWETDTLHEDSVIMKTFYFKFFSKYFGLIMVAFAINYVELLGDVHKCPDFQCMPVVQCMFVAIMVMEITYQQLVLHIFPRINKWIGSLNSPAGLEEAAGIKKNLTPQEEQFQWNEPTPVVDLYKDKVYQFGYIAMFGIAFPLVVPLCLAVNLVELRARAEKTLTTKRPDPASAADIGSYQVVLQVCLCQARVLQGMPVCVSRLGHVHWADVASPCHLTHGGRCKVWCECALWSSMRSRVLQSDHHPINQPCVFLRTLVRTRLVCAHIGAEPFWRSGAYPSHVQGSKKRQTFCFSRSTEW